VILVSTGTPSQRDFVHSPAPFPAFVGGYGSGKTHALSLRALRLLIEDTTPIAYYMPTYDLVRTVGFPRLRELLANAGIAHKANSSTFTIDVQGMGQVLFRTMEDPDRLVGYEVGHSLLDELDTLPSAKAELIWQRALSRNRKRLKGNACNSMAVGTTPEGFRFVYEQWGRDEESARDKGYVLYRGKTTDNPHLPPDYITNLRAQYPANLLEAYLNGEFVNLSDGIVQRHWLKPSTADIAQLPRRAMGVDLAISLKESADSSTLAVMAQDADNVGHVLHAAAKKATFHEVQQWIIEAAEVWKPSIILIEATQYQMAAVQELMRTTRLPVVPIKPDRDKAARLMPLAARYEQGFIRHAPANNGNAIKALEDELTAFPNGAHDDLVDALVYAWMGLARTAPLDIQLGGARRDNWRSGY